jgi:hypothetical protein
MVSVGLRRFGMVMVSMRMMGVRHVSVMPRLFVLAGFMMLGGLVVMLGSFFVMAGSVAMVFCSFVGV